MNGFDLIEMLTQKVEMSSRYRGWMSACSVIVQRVISRIVFSRWGAKAM